MCVCVCHLVQGLFWYDPNPSSILTLVPKVQPKAAPKAGEPVPPSDKGAPKNDKKDVPGKMPPGKKVPGKLNVPGKFAPKKEERKSAIRGDTLKMLLFSHWLHQNYIWFL